VANVVGGITFNHPLGDFMTVKLNLSRRPVTDSLLSYAGTTDPLTGKVWGAVTRMGSEGIFSYDDTNLGIYAKFGYGVYDGKNVPTNQSYELTTGAYFRPYKDENSELKVGISGTYLSYNQNLSYFSYGQGGYFSPQSFYSLTFPIDWTDKSGKFSYDVGGAIGVQTIQQNASPFFPSNPGLQSTAYSIAATDSTRPAVYVSQSTTALAFALHLGFEYALTPRTSLGAKANFDNSNQYDQGTVLLYLRSAIN